MSYSLPDGIQQSDIDAYLDGGGYRVECHDCGHPPEDCQCCKRCGAKPDQACDPQCGFEEAE